MWESCRNIFIWAQREREGVRRTWVFSTLSMWTSSDDLCKNTVKYIWTHRDPLLRTLVASDAIHAEEEAKNTFWVFTHLFKKTFINTPLYHVDWHWQSTDTDKNESNIHKFFRIFFKNCTYSVRADTKVKTPRWLIPLTYIFSVSWYVWHFHGPVHTQTDSPRCVSEQDRTASWIFVYCNNKSKLGQNTICQVKAAPFLALKKKASIAVYHLQRQINWTDLKSI